MIFQQQCNKVKKETEILSNVGPFKHYIILDSSIYSTSWMKAHQNLYF